MTILSSEVDAAGEQGEWTRPGPPLWGRVPGSTDGTRVLALRTWDTAYPAMRKRDLSRTPRQAGMAGVTDQPPEGLLRRGDSRVRDLINPTVRPAHAAPYRERVRQIAGDMAREFRRSGNPDLGGGFVRPYTVAVTALFGGLTAGEAETLIDLSARTTGTLLDTPGAHEGVAGGWRDLEAFTGPVLDRIRRYQTTSFLAPALGLLDKRAGRAEVTRTLMIAFNGIPTVEPELLRVLEQALGRGALDQVAHFPALAGAVVREGLSACPFTFGLPGPLTGPVGDIPAGTLVLPVILAAHRSLGRSYDLRRQGGDGLAWGAGTHRCLGMHLARIAMTEAVLALSLLGLKLDGPPGPWQPGIVPVCGLRVTT